MTTQCSATRNAHGRHWRCTRNAAAKYGYQVCGSCASMMPAQCRRAAFDGKEFHSAMCKFTSAPCNLT
jgi:hypothetical protein